MDVLEALRAATEAGDEKKAMKELVRCLGQFDQSIGEIRAKAAEIAEKYDSVDAQKLVDQYEQVKARVDQIAEAVKNARVFPHGNVAGLGDEAHKFSIVRLFYSIKTGKEEDAPFEHEVCRASMEALRKDGQSVNFPETGGFLVPMQVVGDMIAQLFARSVLMDLQGDGTTRVSVLNGLVGQHITLPKARGGVQAYWIGEQQAPTESNTKVGNITMRPRKLGALARLSREVMRWSSPGIEQMLRRDMVRALSEAVDFAILYGTGTDHMPRGVVNNPGVSLYRTETSAVIDSDTVVSNAAGGEWNYDAAINMAGHLEDNNVALDDSFAFISHPSLFRKLRKLKVENYNGQTSGQPYLVGLPVMSNEELRDLLGHDYDATTQVQNKQKAGASAGWGTNGTTGDELKHTDVFAANWSDVLFGMWGALEIDDDEGKSNFAKDETLVLARMYCDTGFRHDESLIWSPDAKALD